MLSSKLDVQAMRDADALSVAAGSAGVTAIERRGAPSAQGVGICTTG